MYPALHSSIFSDFFFLVLLMDKGSPCGCPRWQIRGGAKAVVEGRGSLSFLPGWLVALESLDSLLHIVCFANGLAHLFGRIFDQEGLLKLYQFHYFVTQYMTLNKSLSVTNKIPWSDNGGFFPQCTALFADGDNHNVTFASNTVTLGIDWRKILVKAHVGINANLCLCVL